MNNPTLTPYIDAKSQRWHVRLTWPGDRDRPRPSLGIPADQDPAEALAHFQKHILPGYVAKREQRLAREAAEQAEANRPEHTKKGPLLKDLRDWFCKVHLRFDKKADKTRDHYERTIDDFLSYCRGRHVARSGQLSGRIIQEWQLHLNEMKQRDTVSRDQIMAIRRWLTVCEEHGEVKELPAIKWVIPGKTKSKRFRAYGRDVITPWLEGLRTWRPHVWLVCAWVDATGWRISDALDFRVGEIDRVNNYIDRDQLKTSAGLPWPLNAHLLSLIDTALQGREGITRDTHVFLDHRGEPWEYQRLVKVLTHYHQGARWDGPALTFRDLRKSFGSRLAMAGCPPNVLKELMGHADVTLTLSYYVDVDLGRMNEWASAQKL